MGTHSTIYEQAHLVVAAIRIWIHSESRQPMVLDVSARIGFSVEATQYVCRCLEEVGAITITTGAFDERLSLRNHLLIEKLAEKDEGPSMEEQYRKVEDIREERKKSMEEHFDPGYVNEKKAELRSKLDGFIQDPGRLRKENPLDKVFGGDKTREKKDLEESD